jgi:hypothetical protein
MGAYQSFADLWIELDGPPVDRTVVNAAADTRPTTAQGNRLLVTETRARSGGVEPHGNPVVWEARLTTSASHPIPSLQPEKPSRPRPYDVGSRGLRRRRGLDASRPRESHPAFEKRGRDKTFTVVVSPRPFRRDSLTSWQSRRLAFPARGEPLAAPHSRTPSPRARELPPVPRPRSDLHTVPSLPAASPHARNLRTSRTGDRHAPHADRPGALLAPSRIRHHKEPTAADAGRPVFEAASQRAHLCSPRPRRCRRRQAKSLTAPAASKRCDADRVYPQPQLRARRRRH